MGEYSFRNYGSVDVISNSVDDIYYTEAHEYTHKEFFSMTSSGNMVMMLELTERYCNEYKRLKNDLIEKMRIVHESIAMFKELCLFLENEGIDKYEERIRTMKKNSDVYYDYFSNLEFLLEYMETDKAYAVAELLAVRSLNIDIFNIPLDIKERNKFYRIPDNQIHFVPNVRFKKLCKSVKSYLEGNEESEDLQSISNSLSNTIMVNNEFLNKLKLYILNLFQGNSQFHNIKDRIEGVKIENDVDEALMLYPTLLNGHIKKDMAEFISNWRDFPLNDKAIKLPMLLFNSKFDDNFVYSIISNVYLDKNEKNIERFLTMIPINEISEFVNFFKPMFVMIGNINRSYLFDDHYFRKSNNRRYIFIDNAIVDSIDFINLKFENAHYRIFNYESKYSIMIIRNRNLKVIQPLSIHAYSSVKKLVNDKKLKLKEVEIQDDDLDEFVIKSKEDKFELDFLISTIYYKLYEN